MKLFFIIIFLFIKKNCLHNTTNNKQYCLDFVFVFCISIKDFFLYDYLQSLIFGLGRDDKDKKIGSAE